MGGRLKDILILAGVAMGSTAAVWVGAGMRTIYQNFDGPYYAVVARCGYDRECARQVFSFPLPLEYYPAHFPLYPLLSRIIGQIGDIGLIRAGVIVNLLATAVAAVVIYEVSGKKLWVGWVWLFMWPRMWAVRSIVSPETLFILFIMLALHFFSKEKYWRAGIMGALAVWTKSPGILLLPAFVLARPKIKIWPVVLIPLALLGLFGFYKIQTGDFWAYFHSGDNIHLQALPFRVFDSGQAWVGDFWLEEILWVYLIGLIGVIRTIEKNRVWGMFGAVFYASILFVSHRDISRYSLPLVPVVLLGLSTLLERKEVRWALIFLTIPAFFYTINFLNFNQAAISDWSPFLSAK